MKIHFYRFIMMSILLFSSQAFAETTEISLDIARYVSDWEIEGEAVETRLTEAGFRYYEAVSPYVESGVGLGYLWLTQKGNPVSDGLHLSGNYLGLFVHADVVRSLPFHLGIAIDYRFNTVEDENETNRVQISWHELYGGITMMFRVNEFEFKVQGGYRILDGDETETHGLTRGFDSQKHGVAILTIDYYLEPNGYVGMQVSDGAQQGIQLVFARLY